ncbi:MAG TPA: hemerythrin domain-containing protein [Candidatus Obscuribacterales bacterium]
MTKGVDEIINKVELMFESGKTDAVNLLKTDHRKVEMLINEFLASDGNKKALMNKIIEELSIHASVEEDLVYPILENSDKDKVVQGADEAEEEHHVLKMALADLAAADASPRKLKAKMMVVRDLVKHHVKEEESKLLPELKKTDTDLELLGQQIRARKEQLKRRVKTSAIGKNKDRTKLATTSRSKNVGASKGKTRTRKSKTATSTRKAYKRTGRGNKRAA